MLPSTINAIEYGGVGGRPAYPRPDIPRSESIFINNVRPGEQLEEGVKVINNSSEKKTLLIYATDSTPSTDGGFACEQFVEEKNNVGAWISLSKSEVQLETLTNEVVPFKIEVPKSVDTGEHNGCIVIQEKKEVNSEQTGVILSLRTAIRVALTVPGEIIRFLKIENFEMPNSNEEKIVLKPSIRNEGNVSVEAFIKVVVKNVLTGKIVEFKGNYSILRNDTFSLNYEFPSPFFGGRFSAQAFVEYNNGNGEIKLESQKLTFYSLPQRKALIIMVFVALPILFIIIFLMIIGIHRRKYINKWIPYKVRKGDSLGNLARQNNITWQEVARVNKIKKPYEIQAGQVIKLPPEK